MCPVCMESTKDDCVCFPCGHTVCAMCDEKMLARQFLACPTCRTPRAGISQTQVESANRARVQGDMEQEGGALVFRANESNLLHVMFFRNQTDGANPFGPLQSIQGTQSNWSGYPIHHDQLATPTPTLHAEQAAQVAQAAMPHLRESAGSVMQLQSPLRELLDQLLFPGTIGQFLAQRRVVRRQGNRTRPHLQPSEP